MNKQNKPPFAALILAAGIGSRMKSKLPKVLQTVAGKPMLRWQIDTLEAMGCDKIVVVIGPDMPEVEAAAAPHTCVLQTERLGTGHAAQQAVGELKDYSGDVIILYGDTPLVTQKTLTNILSTKTSNARVDMVVTAMDLKDPRRYGRMIVDDEKRLHAIVEHKDATPQQREILLCNAGLFCASAQNLCQWLPKLNNQNAAQEYYLTDIVEIANQAGHFCTIYVADEAEVQQPNSRPELAACEATVQQMLRQQHLESGVQMIAPETVFFSHDTVIGADALIEPHVICGLGVKIGEGAHIGGFCHLSNVTVPDSAVIVPYSHLDGKGAVVDLPVKRRAHHRL